MRNYFKYFSVLVLSLYLSMVVKSQIITTYTFAGNGSQGYTGDGGMAWQAQLNYPYGLAKDASGNFYIGENWNYSVRIVNTSSVINTLAGNGISGFSGDGGASTTAKLNFPSGIAVVSNTVYISDWYNNRIRKVVSGIITTVAGNGVYGYSGDGGSATAANLRTPSGIAVDALGNIYFTEYNNHVLRKVTPSGTIVTVAGTGTAGYSGDGGLATNAQLSFPHGVTVDAAGNIYIVDGSNHCIRKINTSGIISTIAGNGTQGYSGDGGLATSAQLNTPQGISLDGNGNVFISDMANNAIREINSMGVINTVYSGAGIPIGIVNDGSGNILFCSAQNHIVKGFQCPTPTVTIANTNSVICAGQSSTITVSGASNSYYWNTGSISNTIVVSPSVTTTYSVTSTNFIGCSDLSSVTVSVSTCTGIEAQNDLNNEPVIYPNPSTGIFNLKLDKQIEKGFVRVFNSLGQEITYIKLDNASENLQFDLTKYSDGVYFVEIVRLSETKRVKLLKRD